MQALILLSGGMDSVTLLYRNLAIVKHAAVFTYGSKHNAKEIEFARYQCQLNNIPLTEIDLSDIIGKHFKSDLLIGQGDIPEGHYEAESMKSTVVPFRNGIMISITAGLAQSLNLNAVLLANHAGDHAIYSDCRSEFIEAMDKALFEGTDGDVSLVAPFTSLNKREIALIGKELGVDYSKTWSCYKGKDKHCGKCGTCVERKEALQGFDPTIYE